MSFGWLGEDVNTAISGAFQVAKVALNDGDDPGDIMAWLNPAGVDLIVYDVRLFVTTAPTTPGGLNFAQMGIADDAVSLGTLFSDTFILDQSPVPAIVVVETADAFALLPAGDYLNLSTYIGDGGSAVGLVGYAYIYWHPAS